jgi:magnesium-dependent phosphatase 1
MYHLWGSGGSPFTKREDGDLNDASGTKVYLMGYVRQLMHQLKTDPKWSSTAVAVASCCDEPRWAAECIEKFEVGDGITLRDIVSVDGVWQFLLCIWKYLPI